MAKWAVAIFSSAEKKEIVKILKLKSIKQIAYVFDCSPSQISNYYHGLIRGNKVLNTITIYKI